MSKQFNNSSQWAKKTAKVNVPMLKADERIFVNIDSGPKNFKSKFGAVVFVATPGMQQQFTIHHPVGITTLEKDDWVLSHSNDIPILISREKHPHEKDRQEVIEKDLKAAFLRMPNRLYEETKDGYALDDELRTDIVTDAKKESKREWRRLHPVIMPEKGKKKPPNPEKEPEDFYINHLPTDWQAAERQYFSFRKEYEPPEGLVDAWDACHPYQTCSGVTSATPQVPFQCLKGLKQHELSDGIVKAIYDQTTEIRYVETRGGFNNQPSDGDEKDDESDSHHEEHDVVDIVALRVLATSFRALVTANDESLKKKTKGESHARWFDLNTNLAQLTEQLEKLLVEAQ